MPSIFYTPTAYRLANFLVLQSRIYIWRSYTIDMLFPPLHRHIARHHWYNFWKNETEQIIPTSPITFTIDNSSIDELSKNVICKKPALLTRSRRIQCQRIRKPFLPLCFRFSPFPPFLRSLAFTITVFTSSTGAAKRQPSQTSTNKFANTSYLSTFSSCSQF